MVVTTENNEVHDLVPIVALRQAASLATSYTCTMISRPIYILLIAGALALGGCRSEPSVVLKCNVSSFNRIVNQSIQQQIHLELDPGKRSATLLDRRGTLRVSDDAYQIVFPGVRDKSWEMHMKISRLSCQIDWEFGDPPFG